MDEWAAKCIEKLGEDMRFFRKIGLDNISTV